jgi:hypothetical protein
MIHTSFIAYSKKGGLFFAARFHLAQKTLDFSDNTGNENINNKGKFI